ncbi:DUF1488 domain-containing protein [Shewanella olleyana]|uniref:DUF1488 domain-containing protein n=1 Tax=Shewanella olleyana TaxID=135626 RepID=UPI00200E9364|nr:DUF1488 domain-containing protein [Shewanella olleyana]MCL1068073.1 DUF1488 domain-containing protein [Shewanella olleyana]
MNQSIIFTDIVEWNEATKTLSLIAQVQGMNVTCLITSARLERLASLTIQNEQEALTAFEQVRFDIEDIAEALIESESFDEQGYIHV